MYKITIHRKTPTKKNPQIVVAAMHGNSEDWGTFTRTFKHKGIDPSCIAERDMTKEEIKYVNQCWRLHWFSYTQWEHLIQDEWKVTGSLEWVNKLLEISGLKETITEILKPE